MSVATESYATQELVSLFGVTRQAIEKRAKAENWGWMSRSRRTGGKRWVISSMPPATRDAIASAMLREARTAAASAPDSNAPAIVGGTVGTATAPEWTRASDRERTVATARLAFVREIERLSGIVGKEKAVQHLVSASRLGSLAPVLQELISTAIHCLPARHYEPAGRACRRLCCGSSQRRRPGAAPEHACAVRHCRAPRCRPPGQK